MMPKKVSLTQNKLSQILEAADIVSKTHIACGKGNDGMTAFLRVLSDRKFYDDIIKQIDIKNREKFDGIIDVFAADNLAEQLQGLDINELKKIVKFHRLDQTNRVCKWVDEAKVREFIVNMVAAKKNKTQIFY